MQSDTKKRVGILRGGAGEEYETSLRRGGELIGHIYKYLEDKYKPVDILVDKDYIWHMNGLPVNPGDLTQKVDVVWNMSHPSLSNILESLSIPNVGISGFSASLQRSREMLREHMAQIGVRMPRHIILPVYQKDFDGAEDKYAAKKAKEVFEKFSSPWIVRPLTDEEEASIYLARTFPELIFALEDLTKYQKSILVEEFINGKAASIHSVPGFRGEDIYAFPIGESSTNFSPDEIEKLVKLVKYLHNHVGAKYYLKSDFVLKPKDKFYLTGIELLPDLKQDSHFSQACESAGAKMHQVVEHILEGAM